MKKQVLYMAVAVSLGLSHSAHATLVKSDFLTPGDGLLVTDTATQLVWLTPVYTRDHTYNDSFVQALAADHGLRYATAPEAASMINNNFHPPTASPPGDAAGFESARQFFQVFGAADEQARCFSAGSPVACPRTQGLTATSTSAGTHLAFGMIQFGSTGWMIADNPWPDVGRDLQQGSWLVRPASTVPEPSSVASLGAGLMALALARARRRHHS